MKPLLLLSLGIILAAASPATADAELDTEEKKMLYTLGFMVSRNLVPYDLSPDELTLVHQGLADGARRQDPDLDLETFGPQLQSFLNNRVQEVVARQTEAGTAFREKVAAEEGNTSMESGLIYRELTPGDGASPAATDAVLVQYRGTLIDGSVFDDSRDSPDGGPTRFQLGAVIPCFRDGITAMKVGGKSRLTCPPELAYGPRGYPPKILGGATLTFEVELISIEAAAAIAPATP